jgi:uncharacterized protein YhaN
LTAKRHLAFRISEAMKALENEKSGINEAAVKNLHRQVFEYQQKTNDQKRRRAKLAEAEKKSLHYEWLKSAHEQYRGILNERNSGSGIAWQVAALVLMLVSTACLAIQRLIPALLFLAAAMACGVVYLTQTRTALRTAFQSKELDAFRREFEKRFGESLSGLPQVGEVLAKIEPDYYESVSLKKQTAEGEKEAESLKDRIVSGFSELTGGPVEPSSWKPVLEQAEERLEVLSKSIQDKRVELAKIPVDENEFERADPGTDYDARREKQLSDRLEKIKTDLAGIHKRFEELKQKISHETRDAISISWPELIWHLKTKREEVSKNYRDKTAEMLGKIAVVRVAETARKDENAKIEAGLDAPAVKNLLKSMTRRYDRLSLDGETLRAGDAYQEFDFQDLSTGAREQVLLALRIGFASMLSKRDTLFLVLDDAFQYSDWDRREGLVETAAGLARQGWQIFYFTMDDHIRGLFDAKGKEFGREYVSMEL